MRKVQVLETECARCHRIADNARAAAAALSAEIEGWLES